MKLWPSILCFAAFIILAAALQVSDADSSSIFPGEKYFTDFIPIDSDHSLFFWMFKSRDANKNAPLLIWLQGGPGTSGVEVALYENGPYRLNDASSVRRVAHSLNNNTDVMYIDQPIGTGFSECNNPLHLPIDEHKVAADLYVFLEGFMKKYPEYKKRPLYFAGQSYGGHFIPGAIPIIMEKHNQDLNIKGIAIGNGHISPINQFPQYAEYAFKKKLIGLTEYLALQETLKVCKFYLNLGIAFEAMIEFYCTGAFNTIVGVTPFLKFNPYDVRESCKHPPACYSYDDLSTFMERPEVLRELNVGNKHWLLTNLEIIIALRLDYWRDYSDGVTYFLEHGVPVVLFYGKEDFICNYLGGIETIKGLKWNGAKELLAQEYKPWVVDGKTMGEYKHNKGLTYVEVFDAGHMATMDNPRMGLDIINKLIKGSI